MAAGHHEEIALELMEDFFQDFSEAHEKCEHILIELEQTPDNAELLNELFRHIHTVKGNLVYVGLKDITPIIQSIEDILDALRKGNLHYDTLLSDVILLTLDKTHSLVESRVHQRTAVLAESAFDHLCQVISRVAEVSGDARTDAIRQALTLMDPDIVLQTPLKPAADAPPALPVMSELPAMPPDNNIIAVLAFFGVSIDDDMQFFMDLNAPIEARSRYWQGRTGRLLRLALAMNKHAGEPVSPAQLAAAVILHDVGMAFMPVETLHNTGALNQNDLLLLQTHPRHGHALLASLKRWSTAALAILQHHERIDGTGYPERIQGEGISEAARIISIADTFEARTHERAHTHMTRRPFIRAILEINSCAGSQFDPHWVDVFNQVARALKA